MKGLFRTASALLIAALLICLAAVQIFAANSMAAVSLTPEEEAHVAFHPTLKIGYVQDRIPVSFTDENGEFAGISRYIFDRVSQLSGIDFEYVPLPDGDITYDYLLSGGFDLVSSVEYNKENQTARGILISDPYLSSRKVVVARQGLDFRFDANLSIAISSGSQTIRKVLGQSYPNFEIVDYPSISACFAAVRSGEADLLMQNQYVVEYWISEPINEKLNVIPVLGLDDQLCFSAVVAFGDNAGPSQQDGEVLIGILNKAISMLTEDELGSFTIKAIMDNQYRYTFGDFLYRYRLATTVFVISSIVIVVLVGLLLRQRIRIAENKADDKARNRFLSTMSHEIRTPLNGILGLNYLMSQTEDGAKVKEYLKQSDVTATYLLSLINDMLDMSGLQSGDLELSAAPVDLKLVLDAVNSIAENEMQKKNITYSADAKLDWPCVSGDQVRIQQVLLHLLDNAKKFTSEGGKVEFRLAQRLLPDGRVLIEAEVTDNGRGMSEDLQKHIFDAFVRQLDTVSKGTQGAGLGLSISRQLARMMGGDLTVESRPGEGSTFKFTFTADPAELPESGARANTDHESVRVLVAEDNELNGEIILELLSEHGYAADLAENGRVALEMFSESAPGWYGVILMDLLMPEMDGFEAAMAIRRLDRDDAERVSIFACSANSTDQDRQKAAESGMDGFITKPVDVKLMLKMIEEARSSKRKTGKE